MGLKVFENRFSCRSLIGFRSLHTGGYYSGFAIVMERDFPQVRSVTLDGGHGAVSIAALHQKQRIDRPKKRR